MAQPLAEGLDPALTKRLLSALLLVPLALASVWLGGWSFALLVIGALAAMAWEWGRLRAEPATAVAATIAAVLLPGVAVIVVMIGQPTLALMLLAIGAAAAAALAAAARVRGVDHVALGVVYLGLPAVALVWLESRPEVGASLVAWLLAVVWATDICAYAVGRTIGGARLAPRISPGKTWAGLFGAMIGAALTGAVIGMALGSRPLLAGLLGAALAVVAQAGDLFESALKRRRGVKDSSHLIPGHGGVLDRVDGLLFAAPVYAAVIAISPRTIVG
jgi:phosphatidate cytidylyltransferase